jgi:hypothetical protein
MQAKIKKIRFGVLIVAALAIGWVVLDQARPRDGHTPESREALEKLKRINNQK